MSADRITLTNIALFAHHGVHEEEARLGQRFYIDVVATLDLNHAGQHDDLDRTVDYVALTKTALEGFNARRFRLIEAAAESATRAIFDTFPAIEAVEITVRKPSAPLPYILDAVAVTLYRSRR